MSTTEHQLALDLPQGRARTAYIARCLTSGGRGILGADESIESLSQRLADQGIEPSAAARRDYRQLLLTAPGLRTMVNGIIVGGESFDQSLTTGEQFAEAATARGILIGIKVDTGSTDGLPARLESYAARGAYFARWRAAFDVATSKGDLIRENAHRLAVFARWCQDAGLVPIVEPEVRAAGEHDLVVCAQTTRLVLTTLFDELAVQSVDLAGLVLKPNFVTPGLASPQVSATTVAAVTFDVLRAAVPSEVSGIAFRSGGHPTDAACDHLAAIRAVPARPWRVTFSFGRALISDALEIWGGSPANVTLAQRSLLSNCARASAVPDGRSQGAIRSERPPSPASATAGSRGHGRA